MSNDTYYLVMHKWVNDRKERTGLYGSTLMLNNKGYSCCLGQFASQRGVRKDQLLGSVDPLTVRVMYEGYDGNFIDTGTSRHTKLAQELMEINDLDQTISDYIRAEMIKDRMEKDGLKLIILHSNY